MSVLLIILKIIGYILLGLLALLVGALFVPVTAYVCYERSRLLVSVGALGMKFEVFDSDKPREKEPRPTQEQAPPAEEKTAPAEPRGKPDFELIRALVGAGRGAAARALRGIRIHGIAVVLVARGFDPYETGVNTGRVWAGLGALLTLLRSVWRDLGVDSLAVIPDFMDEHRGAESVKCEITARPVAFLCAGVIFGWRFLKYIVKKKLDERRVKSTERICEI